MNYNAVVSKVAALCGLLLLLVGISYVPDVLGEMNLADRLSAAVSVSTTEYPFQDANIAVTKPQKTIWVRPATSADGCTDQYCSTPESRDTRTWQNGKYTFTVLNKGDETVELFYKKTNIGFAKGSGNNGLVLLRTDVPALIKYKTIVSKASAGMGWTTLKDSPDPSAVEYSYIHTNERVVLAPGEKTTINYEYEVDLKNAMPNKAYYLAISGLAYATEKEGELSTPRENILDFKQNLASGWSPWVMQPSISPGNRPLQDSSTYLEITDVKPLVDKSGLEVSYRFSDPTGKIKAKGSPLITFNGEDHGTGTVFNPVTKPGIRLDLANASSAGKQVILWHQIGLPTVTPDKANKKVVIRWGSDDVINVWDKPVAYPYFNTGFDSQVINHNIREFATSIQGGIPGLSSLSDCYFSSIYTSDFNGTLGKFSARISDSVKNKNAFSLRADCVANKSNPSQSIPFSTEVIVTYAEPSFRVVTPNGGEQWMLNSNMTISWDPEPHSADVEAYLEKRKADGTFENIGKVIPTAKGSIIWNGEVGQSGQYPLPGDGYYIRLVNKKTGVTDRSDNPFTLLPINHVWATVEIDGIKADSRSETASGKQSLIIPSTGKNLPLTWQSQNADECDFLVYYPSSDGGPWIRETIPLSPVGGGSKDIIFKPNKAPQHINGTIMCLGYDSSRFAHINMNPVETIVTAPVSGTTFSDSMVVSWEKPIWYFDYYMHNTNPKELDSQFISYDIYLVDSSGSKGGQTALLTSTTNRNTTSITITKEMVDDAITDLRSNGSSGNQFYFLVAPFFKSLSNNFSFNTHQGSSGLVTINSNQPEVSIEPFLVSTSVEKSNDLGLFKVKFKLKAVGGDVYLSKYAGDLSASPTNKNTFQTAVNNVPLQSDEGISNALVARSSNVTGSGDTYKIPSGQIGEFELTVSVNPEMTGKSGYYLVGVKGLSFSASATGEKKITPVSFVTQPLLLQVPTVNTTTNTTKTNDPCGPGGKYEGTSKCR